MAPVIFLVTVGIPVYHHRCNTEMTSSTQWFIFNESHCEKQGVPTCCKKESSGCCSIDSEIIALKIDQQIHQQCHDIVDFSSFIPSPPQITEFFRVAIISFFPTIERIYPPPKFAYGRTLLNLLQVFRI
jgi:hypothetical protein